MQEALISPNAIIESGAKIGKNVKIGHFCVIGKNVKIGDNCQIANNVTISGHTKIGNNNKIYSNACIGTHPQDLKYANEPTELVIGDDNIIRECVTMNTGTIGGSGVTRVGNKNLFMAYAHIAHDCQVGDECIFANVATLGGHVKVGNYVNMGGLTAAHQFVQIGDGCMLAGGSILVQDLPPYSMAHGSHAYIRGLNKHRMRKIFNSKEIDEISALYKRLYSRTAPLKELVKKELDSKEITQTMRYICEFILGATRGIPFRGGNNHSEGNE
ncbi:acyl-ACP--UDP-N-acetylglucosamine O-acyltransferase [Helicobacter sp. 23-1046]